MYLCKIGHCNLTEPKIVTSKDNQQLENKELTKDTTIQTVDN